jgi:hypothetical protein
MRVLAGMRQAVDAAVAQETDPLDQLYAAIRAYLAYFDDHPEYVDVDGFVFTPEGATAAAQATFELMQARCVAN